MRSHDDGPPAEDEPPKEEMRALVPLETPERLQGQPAAPDTSGTSARQPPPPPSAGPPEEPPKRRRLRSGGHRGSRSSASRSSSTRSGSVQPGDNAVADGGTSVPTEASGRRSRRKRSKEREISRESASSRESRKGDSAVPDDTRVASTASAAQEGAPPRATDAVMTGAPSGWEANVVAPSEREETKVKTPMVSALYLPGDVLHRGTQLVAMAATAADVAGVVANIEASAPQSAPTASTSKAAPSLVPMQNAGKVQSSVPSRTPPREDEECTVAHCVVPACALCLLSCMLILFVFVLLPLLERRPTGKSVCGTRDCVHFANLLGLKRLDAGTNPCEDFGQLVCSAGTKRHRGHAWSTVSHVVKDWMGNIEGAVAVTGHEGGVLERPVHLVHSCLHRQGSDDDAIKSFIQFVHNRTFAWPTDDEENTPLNYPRALMALLELAVRWALPLWFRIELLPSRGGRNRTLTIKPSTLPVIWESLHRELIAYKDLYPNYLRLFHATFFAHRKPSPAYQDFLRESAVGQGRILANLSNAIRVPIFNPRIIQLQQLPSLITQLTAGDWVNALQSVFNASPPIEAGDVILATNGEILAAVGRLFGAYDARYILHHTSWWFLQVIGGFTSNLIFNSASVSQAGKQFQKTVCALQVEATDYLLMAAVSQAKFPSEQRSSIRRHLERVHATALEKVRSSERIHSPVKEALVSVLRRTTAVIWPEDAFAAENVPGNNYSQFVSAYDDANIFTWWRSLREGLQRLMVSGQHAAVAKLPRLDTRTVTSYNPVLDVISVSYTALAPPLYYNSGTSAMLYGGLGFIFAREIAQALGILTTLVDDGGDIIAPSSASITFTPWNNMSCPHMEPSDVEIMFPSLPALEISHAVYLTYRDEKYDLPLKGLKEYSAEQIFFITFCLASCQVEFLGQNLSTFCNSAVENFEPFARAFSCPPGSKMNRESKCRFF